MFCLLGIPVHKCLLFTPEDPCFLPVDSLFLDWLGREDKRSTCILNPERKQSARCFVVLPVTFSTSGSQDVLKREPHTLPEDQEGRRAAGKVWEALMNCTCLMCVG